MKINRESGTVDINGQIFDLEDYDANFHCEIELQTLTKIDFKISEFPNDIIFKTHSEDGFESYLFNELEFSKSNNLIVFAFICHQPNKHWEGQWGLSTMLSTLADLVKDSTDLEVQYESLNIEDDWKYLEITFSINTDFNFGVIINKYSKILNDIIRKTELHLSGVIWKKEYEENENLYSTEILFPLLRKMGFIDVKFNHGVKEYGKDFTFSEFTKFGNLRHFGLQAKAGNMRGNVNSDIDEIIGQLEDAFLMPYFDVNANETRNISTFIIAISGYYTDNSKDKIIQKIPVQFKSNTLFIDRDKTMELIEKYWK